MSKSNKKTNSYTPTPLEATTLRWLDSRKWRWFEDKAEYDKIVEEAKGKYYEVEKMSEYDVAVSNALFSFGIKLDRNSEELTDENSKQALEKALEQFHSDKELQKKVQAAHLFNCSGFKPEISQPQKYDDVQKIEEEILNQLSKTPKGSFKDSRYKLSNEEKRIISILRNYGINIYPPKKEEGLEAFYSRIEKSYREVMQRENYLDIPEKPARKEDKDKSTTNESENIVPPITVVPTNTDKSSPDEKTETTDITPSPTPVVNPITMNFDNDDTSPVDEKEQPVPPIVPPTEDKDNKPSKKPHEETSEAKPSENSDKQTTNWVDKKAQYYADFATQHKDDPKLNYQQDKTKEGFAASLYGATIHYTSPDNVNVSSNSGIEVFNALLREEENKHRPINFPENAPKDTATRLYAACVLNKNPMQGAVPTELDMDELEKCGLKGPEIQKVKTFFNKSKENFDDKQNPKQTDDKDKAPTEDKAPKDNTPPSEGQTKSSDKNKRTPTDFPEIELPKWVEPSSDTEKSLTELNKQVSKLQELANEGKITFKRDTKTKRTQIVATADPKNANHPDVTEAVGILRVIRVQKNKLDLLGKKAEPEKAKDIQKFISDSDFRLKQIRAGRPLKSNNHPQEKRLAPKISKKEHEM